MSPNRDEPTIDAFGIFYEITCELTSSLDLDRVLNRAMDRLVEFTRAERGFILLRDGGGDLVCPVARNMDHQTIVDTRQLSFTIIKQVLNDRQPVVSISALNDPRFADKSSVIKHGLRSLACVPLIAYDRSIGLVYLDNRLRDAVFREEDLGLLTAFANIAGIAITNARYYEEQRRSADEQLRLAQELNRQEVLRARAEEISHCKTQMVRFVSHEILQPLTAMKSFLSAALRREKKEPVKRFVLRERADIYNAMNDQCERMLRVCNDMLDLALIESGRPLELKRETFDLRELVSDVSCTHETETADHKIRVSLPSEPCIVTADRNKINQVLHNLLANAIKYSPSPNVVEVRVIPGKSTVSIEVEDHGIGMSPEQVDRLFQPFERPASEQTPQIIGHGLGLYLSKRLAEAHQGSLSARSELGKGSVFTLELPIE